MILQAGLSPCAAPTISFVVYRYESAAFTYYAAQESGLGIGSLTKSTHIVKVLSEKFD